MISKSTKECFFFFFFPIFNLSSDTNQSLGLLSLTVWACSVWRPPSPSATWLLANLHHWTQRVSQVLPFKGRVFSFLSQILSPGSCWDLQLVSSVVSFQIWIRWFWDFLQIPFLNSFNNVTKTPKGVQFPCNIIIAMPALPSGALWELWKPLPLRHIILAITSATVVTTLGQVSILIVKYSFWVILFFQINRNAIDAPSITYICLIPFYILNFFPWCVIR